MADARRPAVAPRVPEAFVAWLWENRHFLPSLATTDGLPVQVVYPGRRGGSWGPDFHGALVVIGGEVVRGDVEVHAKARDWFRHGHHRDLAYVKTVLHVVLESEPGIDCHRADGTIAPTVALGRSLAASRAILWRRWETEPRCSPHVQPCRDPAEAVALLEGAGMERFEARAGRFEADMTVVSSEQALWAGLCDALGFAANRAPFRALADRVPAIEVAALGRRLGEEVATAVLFGEAGLLPSQRGRLPLDEYSRALEEHWARTGRRGPRQPLGWRWIGVRPANQPVRRVAGAAALAVGGSGAPGLAEQTLALLAGEPAERAHRALVSLIQRASNTYWAERQDFATRLPRPAALIGTARAREITVNVLLPWAAAIAATRRDAALGDAARAAYRRHPRLPDNAITRHMERQLLGLNARSVITTACRQQGLHHLFSRWCDARDCGGCLAGGGFVPSPRNASCEPARSETLW